MSYQLDTKRLFRDLGGATRVARRLTEMGLPVRPATVRQWTYRGGLDAVYLANLLAHAALVERRPVDLNHYLTPICAERIVAPRASQRAAPVVHAP